MHLIFCSNEKSEGKCLHFRSVFQFSLKKKNLISSKKYSIFLLSLPHKPNPNLNYLVVISFWVLFFFQKADLFVSHFHWRKKNKCVLTHFSFLIKILKKLPLDLLETFIIRLNEILYTDKMLSGTCSTIIRTYHYSITPDI